MDWAKEQLQLLLALYSGQHQLQSDEPFGDAWVDLSICFLTPCLMIYDHYC